MKVVYVYLAASHGRANIHQYSPPPQWIIVTTCSVKSLTVGHLSNIRVLRVTTCVGFVVWLGLGLQSFGIVWHITVYRVNTTRRLVFKRLSVDVFATIIVFDICIRRKFKPTKTLFLSNVIAPLQLRVPKVLPHAFEAIQDNRNFSVGFQNNNRFWYLHKKKIQTNENLVSEQRYSTTTAPCF